MILVQSQPTYSYWLFGNWSHVAAVIIYVSQQELITKKIEELKCPGDEEFAEYIIVMLHNDKTAAEVQSELEPFLGKQSAVFTPWLESNITCTIWASPEKCGLNYFCYDEISSKLEANFTAYDYMR